MTDDLIDRLKHAAMIHEEIGGQTVLAATIREAAAALEAAREDAWQPIETAPKDGREILVSEYGDLKIAFWSEGVSKWLGPYDRFGDPEVMVPTHWMPLPAMPKEARNG